MKMNRSTTGRLATSQSAYCTRDPEKNRMGRARRLLVLLGAATLLFASATDALADGACCLDEGFMCEILSESQCVSWGGIFTDFVDVAAGGYHSMGLKTDGSIVAWGMNTHGECNVPAPNADFVAVAAGLNYGLGLKSGGSIKRWKRGFVNLALSLGLDFLIRSSRAAPPHRPVGRLRIDGRKRISDQHTYPIP